MKLTLRDEYGTSEMCDTSETCDMSNTRLRTRRAQDLSYKLKVNEFDDLTNTCCPELDRGRTTTQTEV